MCISDHNDNYTSVNVAIDHIDHMVFTFFKLCF